MFTIGKYKGKQIADIVQIDACYCKWFYDELLDKCPDICDKIKDVIDVDSIYLNFGKHKNKCLKTILVEDPKYFDFLVNSDYIKKNRQDIIEEVMRLNTQ